MGITDGMYQLGHAAQVLNRGSDALNETLTRIDEILGRLGIGMEYTLSRPLHEDAAVGADGKRVILMGFLSYGRHRGRFRLLYKTIKVLESRKAMASEDPGSAIPLLDAPRRVRHLAVDQLPDLVGGLAQSVDDVLAQLDRRQRVAHNVLSQLEAMLADTGSNGFAKVHETREPPPATASRGVGSFVESAPADLRPKRKTAPGHLGHG